MTDIDDFQEKLTNAKRMREQDTGGLLLAPAEEISIPQFNAHQTALRLADPIKYMAIQRQMMIRAYQTIMIKSQDYGLVQGCGDRPMLFKAGAEKAANLFGLSIQVKLEKEVEDWDKEFFSYTYKAVIRDRERNIVAECVGNCNSKEKKYRYRWIPEKFATPQQKTDAIQRKENTKYKGSFDIQVKNPDICDQVNTIMKMAQKRAIVGGVLIATNSSAFFGNAEMETAHGYDVPSDRPQWITDDSETFDADVELVVSRDWLSILARLSWTTAKLIETATANGLPTSSKDMTAEQSDQLFEAVLFRLGLESNVFKAAAHCQNSLNKLPKNLTDLERVDLWLAKIEEKKEPTPGLE